MSDTLNANFVADGTTVMYFLVIGCAGINFIIEFIVNAVASPAIYTVERVVERAIVGRGRSTRRNDPPKGLRDEPGESTKKEPSGTEI